MNIPLILILAVVNEGIIEYLGEPIPSRFKPHAAALLGMLICLVFNADLFAGIGFVAQVPFAGAVVTGLVIGRGSNYLADGLKRLNIVAVPSTTTGRVEAVAERAEARHDQD